MPELSTIYARREVTFRIPVGPEPDTNPDDVLTLRYHPDRFTPEMMDRLAQASARARTAEGGPRLDTRLFEETTAIIASLLSWWDLTEDGEPVPITAENLKRLGLPLCLAISNEVMTDFNQGKLTMGRSAKDSGGGSSTGASAARDALSGIPSSGPAAISA